MRRQSIVLTFLATSAVALFVSSTVAAVIVPRPAAHHRALAARTAPTPAVVDVYRHRWALSPSAEVEPTTTTSLPSVPVTSVPVAAHPAEPRPRSRVRATAGAPQPSTSKWACIIDRESRGDPTAVNRSSGAGGLYQFLPTSWRAYGGTGLPQDASVAEQTRVAETAYARSGWAPWAGDGC